MRSDLRHCLASSFSFLFKTVKLTDQTTLKGEGTFHAYDFNL